MTKTIKFLTTLLAIILLSSFTDKNSDEFIGTFSVPSSNPSQIKLTIHSDHTYYYQDFSIPDKKIAVKGTWKQKGRRIILEENNSANKFHNVWTFVENGQVAKSRKGLTFYRLCKIDG
jgi:hypothetical protein